VGSPKFPASIDCGGSGMCFSRSKTGLTLKDVKNEGRSGDVYENKGISDKMPDHKADISA
jgi:hypothetical protein